MDAVYLSAKFGAARSYARYVTTGTDEQQRRWMEVYTTNSAHLTEPQRQLVGGFTRSMNVLVLSGIWCGDCVQQCPLLQRIAEANSTRVDLRFLDRDEHQDLSDRVRLCGGNRVPVVLFLAEDFELCGLYGDRTLNRYRALAARQLGLACPTGLIAPGAQELSATLQDWLGEFERIQLMLRLSARLRQKHGD